MTGVSGGSIAPMEPPLDSSGNPMKPVLPDGFKDVKIRINGTEVTAWTNNTFYIFFATSPEGNTGWYLYDTAEGRWIRYTDFLPDLAEDGNRTETTENSLEEAEQLGRKIERLENKTAKIEKQIEQAESDMAGKMVQSAAIVGGILLIPMIICVVLLAGISKKLKQREVQ